MAIPFLAAVAKAYISRYSDFSEIMFVFPSRRAGTFFMKNLKSCMKDRVAVLPEITTLSDFVEKISGGVVASRLEQLFICYSAYVDLLRKDGVVNIPEFDSFRRWGETAISDFNEVDMQDADPDAIFKNVKDVKEISANFLTEEQLKVMQEYFGQDYSPEDTAKSFWKDFTECEGNTLHKRFRLIWQVLAPLYHEFGRKLEEKGLISSGKTYRKTAEILEKGIPSRLRFRKIVFVGFNALTRTECRIFDALASAGSEDGDGSIGEFLWDATGPVIKDPSSAAGRYVQSNIKRWPAPEWALPYLSEADEEEMPHDIRVIGVASNSMQTKVVADVLEDLGDRLPQSDFENAKVAVVLPDEGLLIPMLYSFPENIRDVNLTMGYPLKLSGVATYVSLLRRLQASRRKTATTIGYYFRDFDIVLSHPFSHVLFGSAVSKVKDWMRLHHRAIVNVGELGHISSDIPFLLKPLSEDASPSETASWLDTILEKVSLSITHDPMNLLKANVDVANIEFYRLTLKRMLDITAEYGISMNWHTFLSLTDRLVSAETVTFEGQPLKGLQVMGLLETRALDFDRVIIPSLNERILPARRRPRTFISDSLRKAYGLPPVNYSESLFAYYFYRMISRAKEVVLLFDSRSSDGARSGDVSRYVLQLKYLYAPETVKMESRSFVLSKSDLKPSPVEKTPAIMDMLSTFRDPGPDGNNLSATALTKYTSCQLRFYFEHVLRIRTDEEATDYIDSITQGSIVHYVMEHIYLPEGKRGVYLTDPVVIDKGFIEARIKDIALIDRLIRKAVNKLHFHREEEKLDMQLTGSAAYVARILRKQILGILRFDLSQSPFTLYGVEIAGDVALKMPEGDPVNMRFAIDRLDSIAKTGKNPGEKLRIVDYKTGTIHAEATSMESIFEGEYSSRNLLQLWLYANLFDALPDKNLKKDEPRPLLDLFGKDACLPTEPMILELYDVAVLKERHHSLPVVEGEVCLDHAGLNGEFLMHLENMLTQIFDEDQPFRPTADESNCTMCQFKTICWR